MDCLLVHSSLEHQAVDVDQKAVAVKIFEKSQAAMGDALCAQPWLSWLGEVRKQDLTGQLQVAEIKLTTSERKRPLLSQS